MPAPEGPQYPLQPAFSRGEVSPYLFGRVDLATFVLSLRTLRNGFVRPEGAVSNRVGFGFIGGSAATATTHGSVLLPFQFSATQSYVLEIANQFGQIYSQGALVIAGASVAISNVTFASFPIGPHLFYVYVITTATPHGLTYNQNINIAGVVGTLDVLKLNGSNYVSAIVDPTTFQIPSPYRFGFPLQGVYTSGGLITQPSSFVTPWAVQDLQALRWSQSADTLTVVHPKYPTYEIKRVSSTSFTCTPAVYVNGPFLPQNTDGVTFVYASVKSGTVTLTANANIFNANHVGSLFYMQQQDISNIPPWEANKQMAGASYWQGKYCRSNLKTYLGVGLVRTDTVNGTGQIAPSHSQGTVADGDGSDTATNASGVLWQYQDSGYGIVKITGYTGPTQVTGIVQPNYTGGPGLLPIPVVGGPATAQGPWTFSGNGSTVIFAPLTGGTSSDTSKYYVTINGVYQAPSTYTVISATSITFISAPATGTNNIVVKQISTLGQTSYWAFGAFSVDQGYPSAVTYFPDRLVLAATPGQPVGVWGSKTSQYHDYGVSTPIVASDAFSVLLNARQLNAVSDLIPLSDMLVGTCNIIWRLWGGASGTALSPLSIAANPQSYYGESPTCASVLFGDSAVFAEYDGRRLRDLIYQFAYDKFTGQELTLYSRHLVPLGTTITRLAYKPDPAAPFIFALRSDGVLLCCTYLREQQVIGWARWDTQGTFEDICVIQENSSFSLYALVNRTINGATQRSVERLDQRESLTTFDYQFLDCNSTYDGRNTNATATMKLTGGTTWLAGDTGTLTSTVLAPFLSTDAGFLNEIWLYDASGTLCRALITAFISSNSVTFRLKDPCPATLQAIATATWSFARTSFGGVYQLAGMPVVAYASGMVIGMTATGSGPDGSLQCDVGGNVLLPQAYPVVNVGLTYLTDIETLPLNIQGQETIRQKAKAQPVVYFDLTESRNLLVGTDFSTLLPHAERDFEPYNSPQNLNSGVTWTRINSVLDAECHTCIRQNMPLPITIRMVIPQVTLGTDIS